MGSLYRRKQKLADGTWRELPTIWIKYYQGGRAVRESTGTTKETVARRMLRVREGDVERGIPITPKSGRVTFEEAAADLLNAYHINGKKSLEHVRRRVTLALEPAFRGRRLASLTTADVRTYVANRQAAGAANATINRELAALKRMFTLAVQAGKLHARPHIPMLREDNVRRGFFESAQCDAVCRHLPTELQPLVRFAYLTGWRVRSEILPLEWRQVDWQGRVVRLDPGTTKNREGRSYPFTAALEAVLRGQFAAHEALRADGRLECRTCSIGTGNPSGTSAAPGCRPARRPAYQDASCTTSAGPPCATSSGPACRARQPWRWSGTRRSRSTAAMPSSMPARSGPPRVSSMQWAQLWAQRPTLKCLRWHRIAELRMFRVARDGIEPPTP